MKTKHLIALIVVSVAMWSAGVVAVILGLSPKRFNGSAEMIASIPRIPSDRSYWDTIGPVHFYGSKSYAGSSIIAIHGFAEAEEVDSKLDLALHVAWEEESIQREWLRACRAVQAPDSWVDLWDNNYDYVYRLRNTPGSGGVIDGSVIFDKDNGRFIAVLYVFRGISRDSGDVE